MLNATSVSTHRPLPATLQTIRHRYTAAQVRREHIEDAFADLFLAARIRGVPVIEYAGEDRLDDLKAKLRSANQEVSRLHGEMVLLDVDPTR